ncbi:TetR/AcrR family transcriptional regulator [Mycoplasmatota bacterium]|nr:TetR/AcrR family transcriptional regulator [Mycoplasmatota bacterium]
MNNLSRKERERLQRETEIINSAEKIFARDGFEHASMNEIAKEAEFSKRTLYQYFEDKNDLYLTVALRLYNNMYRYFSNLNSEYDSGLEKIKANFFAYYRFYKKNESNFRIIYDIGNVRQKTENPKIMEFLKIDKLIFEDLLNLVIEGQQDGSISKELDVRLTTSSLIFLLTGFLNQLTITGDNYSKHSNMTIDDLSSYVFGLLYSAMK